MTHRPSTRRPSTTTIRWQARRNAAVRAGVVPAAGGATRWLSLPGDPRQHYIPRIKWVGSAAAKQLALEFMNRKQNQIDIYLFNTATGEGKVFFTDRDAAWVDVMDELRWLPPAKTNRGSAGDLLWLSERDGWRHAYRITPDGKPHLLTDFAADVIDLVAVNDSAGYLYFAASPTDAVRQYLYRVRLDGTGKPERMTPVDQVGWHRYVASPDGKVALHGWSTATRPWRFDLVQLADGKVLKPLGDNAALDQKAKPLIGSGKEFFQVPVDGGARLNGWIIKPPDFNPAKKYPVLVYVYGEACRCNGARHMVRGGGLAHRTRGIPGCELRQRGHAGAARACLAQVHLRFRWRAVIAAAGRGHTRTGA